MSKAYSHIYSASVIVPAAILLPLALGGCGRKAAPDERVYTESRSMMSTEIILSVAGMDEATARGNIQAAFARLETLQRALNAHDPQAELATVNAEAAARPVKVKKDLFDCIRDGVKWHGITNGTFDITCGPLLKLWRDCAQKDRLPTAEELAAARSFCDADGIELDEEALTVRLPRPGVQLDLGGLGKGFCMDRVAALLRERGVRNALLAASGDILAIGCNPQGRPWRVGIQDPRSPGDPTALLGVLALSDKSVSTAGNYQRYVTIQGKRYSHIVDPRTGLTADNVPSVTVIGPDSTTTDILDTALSVMGVEEGMKYVEAHEGIEAMFVQFDADNKPVITQSKGFTKYLAEEAK